MSFCREQQIAKLTRTSEFAQMVDLDKRGVLEPELMAAVLAANRAWEAKFGQIVAATHRDQALKRQRYENVHSDEYESGKRFKSHPYLASPRYDGADANLNPQPNENVHSEEALRNELQNQLNYQPGQRPRYEPKPY